MNLVTLAFSGGIDSTAALLKLFNEYEFNKITAHHVKLTTREGVDRAEAEVRACHRIHKWFRERGMRFDYTESEYNCLFDARSGTPDIVRIVPIVTSALLHHAEVNGWVNMTGKGYDQLCLAYGDHADEFALVDFRARWNLTVSLFRDIMFSATELWEFIPSYRLIVPNLNSTKKDNYEYLPDDLRALTTSCRKGRNCGNCKTCLEIYAARGEDDTEYIE